MELVITICVFLSYFLGSKAILANKYHPSIYSRVIWIFTNLPILNLTIGLVAHFIGGIPTYKQVIKNPAGEDIFFWFFFFLASTLALFKVDWGFVSSYLYPLYFALFDGLMTLLCMRRYKIFRLLQQVN